MIKQQTKNEVVSMLFEIDTLDKKKIVDSFQFELSRLWATINAMNEVDDIKLRRDIVRVSIIGFLSGKGENNAGFQAMIKEKFNGDVEEYMRTLMINWVSTYDSLKNWLNDNKGKSINIITSWDAKKEVDPKILVGDYDSFITAYNKLSKKYKF